MPVLDISLLGPPVIAWNGAPVTLLKPRSCALLYRLAVQEEPVPCQHIGFLFWPRQSDATVRRYVSRLFTITRRFLPDKNLIFFENDLLQFDLTRVQSDANRFHHLASKYTRHQDTQPLSQLVELYRGPLLQDFRLANSPEYEAWVQVARTLWERDYLAVLHLLLEHAIQASDDELAITSAQRYLALDPLHEETHRCLIELFGRCGDVEAANRQYALCVDLLRRRCGRLPQEATTSAMESLSQGIVPDTLIAASPRNRQTFAGRRQRRRQWQEEPRPRRQKLVLS